MEAQYLTNEKGENVGVYMDMAQYGATVEAQRELYETRRRIQEIEREIAENQRQLELTESILAEFVEGIHQSSQEEYERIIEDVEDQIHDYTDDRERAQRLLDIFENREASNALEAAIEQEDDFVPWTEAKKRLAASREA